MGTKNWLKVEVFPKFYQRFALLDKLTIGRSPDKDITLTEISVSSHHATVWTRGNEVWIRDEGSTNGTKVNGVPIQREHRLYDGDSIGIGYIRLFFTQQQEGAHQIIASQVPDKSKLTESDDIVFTCPCDKIQIISEILEEKFAQIFPTPAMRQEGRDALITALNIIQARAAHPGAVLKFQMQKLGSSFHFTISDEERACCPNLWKTLVPEEKPSSHEWKYRGLDAVDYDEKQNFVILTKNLEISGQKQTSSTRVAGHARKVLVLRYFTTMSVNGSFPVDIAIADEKIEFLPRYPGNIKSSYAIQGPQISETVRVVPVFPGCICTPSRFEIDWENAPAQCQFWITPLVRGLRKGFLQVITRGQTSHYIQTPYLVKSQKLSTWLLGMSLWLPALLILFSIFELPLKDEVPVVLLSLIVFGQAMGGLLGLAIILGSISLVAGIVMYFRSRPRMSKLIYDTLEI